MNLRLIKSKLEDISLKVNEAKNDLALLMGESALKEPSIVVERGSNARFKRNKTAFLSPSKGRALGAEIMAIPNWLDRASVAIAISVRRWARGYSAPRITNMRKVLACYPEIRESDYLGQSTPSRERKVYRSSIGGSNLTPEQRADGLRKLLELRNYYGGSMPLLAKMLGANASTTHTWIRNKSMRSVGYNMIDKLYSSQIQNRN